MKNVPIFGHSVHKYCTLIRRYGSRAVRWVLSNAYRAARLVDVGVNAKNCSRWRMFQSRRNTVYDKQWRWLQDGPWKKKNNCWVTITLHRSKNPSVRIAFSLNLSTKEGQEYYQLILNILICDVINHCAWSIHGKISVYDKFVIGNL